MKKTKSSKKNQPDSLLKQGLKASKSVLATVAIFSFFVNLSMLTLPFYMLQVFDRVMSSRSESTLILLTIIVIFILFIFSILDIARSWLMVRISNKLDKHLNVRVFEAVFERSVQLPGGGHAQALRDMETLRTFLSGNGLFAFFDAPWIPLFLIVLFMFHPYIGVLSVVGGTILFMFALLNEFLTRKAYKEISSGTVETNNFAESSLRNSEAIKAMGMLGNIRGVWQEKHNRLLFAQTKSNEQSAIIMALAKFIRISLQITAMGIGALFVIRQIITPGTMIAAVILMGRVLAPLEQSVGQWRALGNARAAYDRLEELLENMPEKSEGMTLPRPTGELTVQQLVIMPPGGKEVILRGINADLAAGESLGVLGPSGVGKSSFARCLVGIWSPMNGHVRLDGVDTFNWNSEAMGSYIGFLPQDVELFDGTVAENIARFTGADADSIIAAANESGTHEMILRMPDGYDTRIGEGGSILSGGQRQRIGLTRALFGDPPFVVLDEPNSNLDVEGENELINTLKKLKDKGTTVVIIAHRPKLLKHIDKIMLLRGGTMQAFGPRDEVIKQLPGIQGQANRPGLVAAGRLGGKISDA